MFIQYTYVHADRAVGHSQIEAWNFKKKWSFCDYSAVKYFQTYKKRHEINVHLLIYDHKHSFMKYDAAFSREQWLNKYFYAPKRFFRGSIYVPLNEKEVLLMIEKKSIKKRTICPCLTYFSLCMDRAYRKKYM